MNFKEKLKQIIIILVVTFILYKLFNNTNFFVNNLKSFISIINPFIWAFAIAYLLNPILNYVERKLKTKRAISILLIYVFVFGSIHFCITILSPKIINSLNNLTTDIPSYLNAAQLWVNDNLVNSKFSEFTSPYMKNNIARIADQALVFLDMTFTNLLNKAINVTYSLFNAILGIIISIYLLKDKEIFKKNIKKLIFALYNNEQSNKIIHYACLTHKIFSQFIIGKAIDSLIIGVICLIGLILLKIRYALLIAFIVGLTNMIPYFGPFFGAVPAIVITLFYSPIKAFWIAIFILILQQFDGLYLGPKILGDKVGLSPIWIIVAVIVGGGTFGVLGMFLGVPATALIKHILEEFVSKKLKTKNIDPKTYI